MLQRFLSHAWRAMKGCRILVVSCDVESQSVTLCEASPTSQRHYLTSAAIAHSFCHEDEIVNVRTPEICVPTEFSHASCTAGQQTIPPPKADRHVFSKPQPSQFYLQTDTVPMYPPNGFAIIRVPHPNTQVPQHSKSLVESFNSDGTSQQHSGFSSTDCQAMYSDKIRFPKILKQSYVRLQTLYDATAIYLALLGIGWLGLCQMIENQVWPAKFILPGLYVILTPLGMVAGGAEGVTDDIPEEITGDPVPPDLVDIHGMLSPPVKGIVDEEDPLCGPRVLWL